MKAAATAATFTLAQLAELYGLEALANAMGTTYSTARRVVQGLHTTEPLRLLMRMVGAPGWAKVLPPGVTMDLPTARQLWQHVAGPRLLPAEPQRKRRAPR